MRIVSGTLVILGLLIGSAIGAMAGATPSTSPAGEMLWIFQGVVFANGDTVTGSFVTNPTLNGVDSFDIVVSGPAGQQDFTAATCCAYLPNAIGFAGSSWFQFVDLSLTSPLTSAGGVIPIGGGYDCDGDPCWVLLVGGGHNPEVIGTPVPESSALLNLDLVSSLGLLGFLSLRRKISHA